jgi:hypothetical protein
VCRCNPGFIGSVCQYHVPTSKDQCKQDGWKAFNPPAGPFRNQGQCIAYVEQHQHDDDDTEAHGGNN